MSSYGGRFSESSKKKRRKICFFCLEYAGGRNDENHEQNQVPFLGAEEALNNKRKALINQ